MIRALILFILSDILATDAGLSPDVARAFAECWWPG